MKNDKFWVAWFNILSIYRKVSNEIIYFFLYRILLGISNYLQKKIISGIFSFRIKSKIWKSNLNDEIPKSLIIELELWNLVWMMLAYPSNHKWYQTVTTLNELLTNLFGHNWKTHRLVWLYLDAKCVTVAVFHFAEHSPEDQNLWGYFYKKR